MLLMPVIRMQRCGFSMFFWEKPESLNRPLIAKLFLDAESEGKTPWGCLKLWFSPISGDFSSCLGFSSHYWL